MRIIFNRSTQDYKNKDNLLKGLINPKDTLFTYNVGGKPSDKTCMAGCEQCFLLYNDYPKFSSLDSMLEFEYKQIFDLRSQGYKVMPIISDSFGWDGAYLASGILDNNNVYPSEEKHDLNTAWTSGVPLVKGDYKKLLSLALRHNVDTIIMTSHGTYDGEIYLRGITKPSVVREAVRLVHKYNSESETKALDLSLTFSIGEHNISQIEKYAAYAAIMGASYVRINRFIDSNKTFGEEPRRNAMTLNEDSNKQVFNKLLELEQLDVDSLISRNIHHFRGIEIPKYTIKPIELLVATDFGCYGEDVLSVGPINRCEAGIDRFGVLNNLIYPCSQIYNSPVGKLVNKGTDTAPLYVPEFDSDLLKKISSIVSDVEFNGCLGYFMARKEVLC